MIDKAADATIRSRLEELQGAIHSSDPMSYTSLELVDQKISDRILHFRFLSASICSISSIILSTLTVSLSLAESAKSKVLK